MPEATQNTDATEWNCQPVDRSGIATYTIAIRAPDDPERVDRAPSLGGSTGGEEKIAALKVLRKAPVAKWREQILAHLADGVPRTFNRIGVELCDRTADNLLGSSAEDALWSAVEDGLVEHTMTAPILFRIRTQ